MSVLASSKWWGIVRSVVLALGAGAAAGVCTAVWTSQSLDTYAAMLLAGKHLPQISTQKPSPIPGTYEEALSRVQEGARTGIATILPASLDSAVSDDWMNDTLILGYGAIVSDDGWVVMDGSVLQDINNPLKESEVWVNGKRYAITSVVRDTQTSAVMVHTNAVDLTPIGFAATNSVRSGEMMFVVDADGGIFPTAIAESDDEVLVGAQHAESFGTGWTLTDVSVFPSAPLLNAAGEFAGLTRKGSVAVLPLHHALEAIRSVVKTGNTNAAFFGAYTVDLAHAYNLGADLTQNLRAGALIFAPDATTHATVRGGPAAVAGFASKDIILAVDGESLTESASLAEILSSYAPGSIARCTVLRAGQTLTISVTLGDAAKLLY